jgi:hypothetical protein
MDQICRSVAELVVAGLVATFRVTSFYGVRPDFGELPRDRRDSTIVYSDTILCGSS